MYNLTDKETGEEFEANKPFFQFYKHNFKAVRKMMKENPLGANLFMFLIENMDSKNALLVSQKALEEALDVGRTSIYNATKYLIENQFIKVLKSGTSNIYCVNADIVWTQRAEKKVHAKFEAAVYLTLSEQDEDVITRVQSEFQKVIDVSKKQKVNIEGSQNFVQVQP